LRAWKLDFKVFETEKAKHADWGGHRKGSGPVSYVIIKELGQTVTFSLWKQFLHTQKPRRLRRDVIVVLSWVSVTYAKKIKKNPRTIISEAMSSLKRQHRDVVFM